MTIDGFSGFEGERITIDVLVSQQLLLLLNMRFCRQRSRKNLI
jgi:hypothetical protein